ncbi:hypothetical protein [Gluconobacter kondonii]|uniref:hypothetical protein n=1 Tax=Gluconobacter kondonii TaxID=941463 RepID=UPI0020125F21|nr:hypothetical protein [Gluconobacter kondonii]
MNGEPRDQKCQRNLKHQPHTLRKHLFMPVMNKQTLAKLFDHKLYHGDQNKKCKQHLDFLPDIGGFFNPV